MRTLKIFVALTLVTLFLSGTAQNAAKNTSVVANCGCPGELWSFTIPYKPNIYFPTITNSKRLMHTGYGFNIPASATITGVKVEFAYNCALTPANTLRDSVVTLFLNGGLLGNDKCGTTGFYSGTGTVVLGGQTDLWGLSSLSPADVNTEGFGFNFKMYAGAANSDLTFENGATITVYYNLANGIKEWQSSSSGLNAYVKNNKLHVNNESGESTQVQIFDLTGKKLIEAQFENGIENSLSVQTLQQGIYIYTISSGSRKKTARFIME